MTEQVTEAIGDWGIWQLRVIFTAGLFCCPTAFHVLIMTFMNAKVDSWCARPDGLSDMSISQWKNISGQTNTTCSVVNIDWNARNLEELAEVEPEGDRIVCERWEYDQSEFTSTITGEFNLVCDNEYLVSMAQTLYFFGMIFGVILFGLAADYFGRKPVLSLLLTGMCITGIITSQMPSYTTFVIARVLNAIFVIGIFEVQFSYSVELVSGKWSTIIGMGMEFSWVTGWLLLGALAYLIRSWRLLMLVTSLPGICGLLLIWLIPESPRWLISKGKLEQAERVIRDAAKSNGKQLPEGWKLVPVQQEEKATKTNFLHLFKTPNMRKKTLILYVNFFVNAGVYFGLTMNANDMGGDVFLNFIISGLMEIPAYLLAMYFMLKRGRRFPYAFSMIFSGLFLLAICLVPRGVFWRDWPAAVLVILGKTCITFSFGALFVYGAELLPTEIRTSGIGSASFIGRIGGMLAPWIGELSSVHPYLPIVIFGIQALISGFVSLFLPETLNLPLPYTIEEAECLEMGKMSFSLSKPRKNEEKE